MFLTERQCSQLTALKDKITVIIPTSQSPRRVFLWSLLSIILRTNPIERLEHFIVCINGPDSRTGNPELQDEKQEMLEELRHTPFLHWQHGMPITIQRVWSRLGHSESLDAAIPWVHTDEYLLVHDDIILLDETWLEKLGLHYGDPSICATQVSPMLNGGFNFSKSKQDDGYHLGFPHLNTAFMLCKRDAMKAIGATWRGYHVAHPTHLAKNDLDYLVSQFGAEVRNLPPVDQDVILVKIFSYDIGAWAYHQIKKTGYRLNPNPLPSETIFHFRGISWGLPENVERRLQNHSAVTSTIEKTIANSPFADFYERWK